MVKEKVQAVLEKLKKIKHIEIYLTAIFAIIIIAIYLSTLGSSGKVESEENNSTENSVTFSTSQEYVGYLENKLVNVLSSVKGAGDVNVVVTLENGFEYVYLTDEEVKTTADGGGVTTNKVVLIDGKPVVVKEIYPTIKGIVVTSSGASDVAVKLNLLNAIQTVIEVSNQNITILTGN